MGIEVIGALKRSDFDMKFSQALGSGNALVATASASRSSSPRSGSHSGAGLAAPTPVYVRLLGAPDRLAPADNPV